VPCAGLDPNGLRTPEPGKNNIFVISDVQMPLFNFTKMRVTIHFIAKKAMTRIGHIFNTTGQNLDLLEAFEE